MLLPTPPSAAAGAAAAPPRPVAMAGPLLLPAADGGGGCGAHKAHLLSGSATRPGNRKRWNHENHMILRPTCSRMMSLQERFEASCSRSGSYSEIQRS